MSEELRRALYASNAASLDIELFIPDLVGVTEILSEEHRKKLCRHLPARAEGIGICLLLPLQHLFHPPPHHKNLILLGLIFLILNSYKELYYFVCYFS
jgi:hypothetical protein